MRSKIAVALLTTSFAVLAACSTNRLGPIDANEGIDHLCIQKNPKVKVNDFIPALEEGFARHGVTSEVYEGVVPRHCRYAVKYTAVQKWNLQFNMTDAKIDIFRDGRAIASGKFMLKPFSPLQMASTQKKLFPVIDELFVNVSQPIAVVRKAPERPNEPLTSPASIERELNALVDAYTSGRITKEEYFARRKALTRN